MSDRARTWSYGIFGTLFLLGAMGCGVALNLVTQPHPGWPTAWLALLVASLTLAALGVTCAVAAILRMIDREIADRIAAHDAGESRDRGHRGASAGTGATP